MSSTDSLHYKLCRKAASWLRKSSSADHWNGYWYSAYKYVIVELVTVGAELFDVWGTNCHQSVLIEVKTSFSDFLADAKKFYRRPGNETYQTGNFRYYCCPEGVIPESEIPFGWGLLVWNGKSIVKRIQSKFWETSNMADSAILCSILRREGITPRIFNYRKAINADDPFDCDDDDDFFKISKSAEEIGKVCK